MQTHRRNLRRPGLAVATLVLPAVLAACAPASAPAAPAAADFAPAPTVVPLGAESAAREDQPRPPQLSSAQLAPDFSIVTLTGERFRLSEQRGKVVGVLFLASWCVSCVPETQAWARLQREYGPRGLEVLLVSADPGDTPADLEEFRRFARDTPDRHWAIDRDGTALVVPYQVQSLDTTLIFDRQGMPAYRDAASTRYQVLKRELEKLL